jgi:hypothetical protein
MKYKNINTGEEAILLEGHDSFYKVSNGGTVPSRFIEDNCSWEIMDEKEYEILEYRCDKLGLNIIAKLKDDGLYHFDGGTYYSPTSTISNINYKIHSVKRLSDGEVFTIGDDINFNDKEIAKLLEIQFEIDPIDKGKGTLCFVNDHEVLGKWWTIDKLSKIKESLFKTVDGIDIYGGEYIYAVSDDFQLLYTSFARKSDETIRSFSTKDAAKEWIRKNKTFKLSDIKRVLEDELYSHSWVMIDVDKILEKLAQS